MANSKFFRLPPLAATLPAIRAAARDINPALTIWKSQTMDQLLDAPLAQPRASALLLSAFGLVALKTTAGEFPDQWTWDDKPEQRASHAALEGKPMPALSVTGWINGEVNPEDMKGKVVIVDFYATWCGPCMAAIPHNNEMMSKFKDKGVQIIGVCTSSGGQEKMEEVVKEKGIKYPTAKDPKLARFERVSKSGRS